MVYFQYFSPHTISFYGETEEDLKLMPTTTKIGEGEYIHAFAPEGSYARLLTADGLQLYMLRSTGWVNVTDYKGGGSGGTNDYNALINKPTINGKALEGNVTSDDIGVASKTTVQGENLIFG